MGRVVTGLAFLRLAGYDAAQLSPAAFASRRSLAPWGKALKIALVALAVVALTTGLGTTFQTENLARDLEEAKTLFQQGLFGQAIARLQSVITRLEQLRELQSRNSQLAEAYFHLGMTHIALNDRSAAKESFQSALSYEPARQLDPDVYAQRVIELFEEARAERTATATTSVLSLVIDHDPLTCFEAGSFPKVCGRTATGCPLGQARAYFRASGTTTWYFVKLNEEDGELCSPLPSPLEETPGVEYYLEVADDELRSANTPTTEAHVVSDGSCSVPVYATVGVISVFSGVTNVLEAPAGFASVNLAGGATASTAAGSATGKGGGMSGATIGIIAGAGAAAAAGIAVGGRGVFSEYDEHPRSRHHDQHAFNRRRWRYLPWVQSTPRLDDLDCHPANHHD